MARPTWSEAVAEYLAHCEARGLSAATLRCRASSLRRFQAITGDVVVWTVTAKHVDKVFQHHNWTAATRNQKLTHFKVFFRWCRARGFMHRDSDPLFGWRMETLPKPDRLRIPQNEWWKIFAACQHPNETMACALGFYLFIRSSEMRAIRLRDIDLDEGEILIYRSKTRDYDIMPITKELDGYLRQHLTWLAKQGATNPEHFLLATRSKPLSFQGAKGFRVGTTRLIPDMAIAYPYKVIQEVLKRAGYPTLKEGAHTLRRSGARAYFDVLVDSGYDGALKRVQSMLGHSHAQMTEHYLGLDLDRRNRNKALKGQPMFPNLEQQDAQIIPIRKGL